MNISKPSERFLWQSAIIAALGGFLFGFDTAVISGAEKAIQSLFELTGFWHGFTVAIALIGTVVGALIAGKPADKYGRKHVLIIIAVLFFFSAIGSALANRWIAFLFFRFLGGLGVGASSVIGPMYIAEIAPARKRGRLVAMFQLSIVTGILIAFLSNYLIETLTSHVPWRWMLGVESIPAAIFFVLLFFIPATPRWLVMHNKSDEAREIMQKLGAVHINSQLKSIEESISSEVHIKSERLFTKKLSYPVMLALLIAFFNQFSGINAIMYYAPRIFEIGGLPRTSALFQSVAIGITNLLFTILALIIIDKTGRKKLLLTGSIGMLLSLALVALSFLNQDVEGIVILVGLLGFIAFFAVSQGAVIWVFISEIFPNKVRAKGQTLGSSTHWILAATVSWLFPVFAQSGNRITTGYTFVFFACMMLIQFFVVYRLFPETKEKSLEEIQDEFGL